MRRVVRVLEVPADDLPGPELHDGLYGDEMLQDMAGYIPEPPFFAPAQLMVKAWGYVVIVASPISELQTDMAPPRRPQLKLKQVGHKPLNRTHPAPLQLRPVGQVVAVTAPQPKQQASPTVRTLRPVRSGEAYRSTSATACGVVTPDLAEGLETIFERFAQEQGFTSEKPLEIRLSRGFKAGSHGHGEGRAADIVAVGDKSLMEWKQEWDQAMAAAEKLSDPQQRVEAIAAEQKRNLGYGLYKALQEHGDWRVDPKGWRPYRGVMQLFGPWTATEGPWKAMPIKDPNSYQRQRLADQQWVFRAHQDHIHVAR
jgi:hypothetical protein